MKVGNMAKEKLKIIPPDEDLDVEDPVVYQLRIISGKLTELSGKLTDQLTVQRQTDWKMWVVMNGLIDSLIENGALKNDPREPQKQ